MEGKSLNRYGGSNRIRFESFSQKLQRVDVDVVHRVRHANGGMDSSSMDTPFSGDHGSFFFDELERIKSLDSTANFRRYVINVLKLLLLITL